MLINFSKITDRRRFGVEVEIVNTVSRSHICNIIKKHSSIKIKNSRAWAQSINNDYWHVKQDATCGLLGKGSDKGWEVASFIGSGDQDICHIAQVVKALGDNGCQTNNNCGLHVHVEINDFSLEQVAVLMAYYAKIEWLILKIVPEHRRCNPYCDTLEYFFSQNERYKCWSVKDLWSKLRPKRLTPFENPYRWRSVNLVNFAAARSMKMYRNRCTIEFRLPPCYLIDVDTRNWIRLFVNFVDYIKNKPMPTNIVEAGMVDCLRHFGLGHDVGIFNIYSKELFETKTWLLQFYITMNKSGLELPKKILNDMWNPARYF